jgi:hypothetical protein
LIRLLLVWLDRKTPDVQAQAKLLALRNHVCNSYDSAIRLLQPLQLLIEIEQWKLPEQEATDAVDQRFGDGTVSSFTTAAALSNATECVETRTVLDIPLAPTELPALRSLDDKTAVLASTAATEAANPSTGEAEAEMVLSIVQRAYCHSVYPEDAAFLALQQRRGGRSGAGGTSGRKTSMAGSGVIGAGAMSVLPVLYPFLNAVEQLGNELLHGLSATISKDIETSPTTDGEATSLAKNSELIVSRLRWLLELRHLLWRCLHDDEGDLLGAEEDDDADNDDEPAHVEVVQAAPLVGPAVPQALEAVEESVGVNLGPYTAGFFPVGTSNGLASSSRVTNLPWGRFLIIWGWLIKSLRSVGVLVTHEDEEEDADSREQQRGTKTEGNAWRGSIETISLPADEDSGLGSSELKIFKGAKALFEAAAVAGAPGATNWATSFQSLHELIGCVEVAVGKAGGGHRDRATLWKEGGAPALPRSRSLWEAESSLGALGHLVTLRLGVGAGAGASSSAVAKTTLEGHEEGQAVAVGSSNGFVTLVDLLKHGKKSNAGGEDVDEDSNGDGGHALLYARSHERSELLTAVCTLNWAAQQQRDGLRWRQEQQLAPSEEQRKGKAQLQPSSLSSAAAATVLQLPMLLKTGLRARKDKYDVRRAASLLMVPLTASVTNADGRVDDASRAAASALSFDAGWDEDRMENEQGGVGGLVNSVGATVGVGMDEATLHKWAGVQTMPWAEHWTMVEEVTVLATLLQLANDAKSEAVAPDSSHAQAAENQAGWRSVLKPLVIRLQRLVKVGIEHTARNPLDFAPYQSIRWILSGSPVLVALAGVKAESNSDPQTAAAKAEKQLQAEKELQALLQVLPSMMGQVHPAMATFHSRRWCSLYDKPDAIHPALSLPEHLMTLGEVLGKVADAFNEEQNRCRPSEGPARLLQSISTPLVLRVLRGVSLHSLALSPPLWARTKQYETGGDIGTSGGDMGGAGNAGEVRGLMPLADSQIRLQQLRKLLWQRLVLTHKDDGPGADGAGANLSSSSSSAVADAGLLRFHWALLEHTIRCFADTLPRMHVANLSSLLQQLYAQVFPANGLTGEQGDISLQEQLVTLLQHTRDGRLQQTLASKDALNEDEEMEEEESEEDEEKNGLATGVDMLEKGHLMLACLVFAQQAASPPTQPTSEDGEGESAAPVVPVVDNTVHRVHYTAMLSGALGMLRLHLLLPSSPLDPALKPALKRAVLRLSLGQMRTEAGMRSWAEGLAGGSLSQEALAPTDSDSTTEPEGNLLTQSGQIDAPNGCIVDLQQRIGSKQHRSNRLRAKVVVRAGVRVPTSGDDKTALANKNPSAAALLQEQEVLFRQIFEAVWRFADSSISGEGQRAAKLMSSLVSTRLRCDELMRKAAAVESEAEVALAAVADATAATANASARGHDGKGSRSDAGRAMDKAMATVSATVDEAVEMVTSAAAEASAAVLAAEAKLAEERQWQQVVEAFVCRVLLGGDSRYAPFRDLLSPIACATRLVTDGVRLLAANLSACVTMLASTVSSAVASVSGVSTAAAAAATGVEKVRLQWRQATSTASATATSSSHSGEEYKWSTSDPTLAWAKAKANAIAKFVPPKLPPMLQETLVRPQLWVGRRSALEVLQLQLLSFPCNVFASSSGEGVLDTVRGFSALAGARVLLGRAAGHALRRAVATTAPAPAALTNGQTLLASGNAAGASAGAGIIGGKASRAVRQVQAAVLRAALTRAQLHILRESGGVHTTSSTQLLRLVFSSFVACWDRAESAKTKRQEEEASLYKHKERKHGGLVGEDEADTDLSIEERVAKEEERALKEQFPDYTSVFNDITGFDPVMAAMDADGMGGGGDDGTTSGFSTGVGGDDGRIGGAGADEANGPEDEANAPGASVELELEGGTLQLLCSVHAKLFFSAHVGESVLMPPGGDPVQQLCAARWPLPPATSSLVNAASARGAISSIVDVDAAAATGALDKSGSVDSSQVAFEHSLHAAQALAEPSSLVVLGSIDGGATGASLHAISTAVASLGGRANATTHGVPGGDDDDAPADPVALHFSRADTAAGAREVQLVQPMLAKLLARIRSLLRDYPAHSILLQIARICERIGQLPLRSPVAQVLACVELLLRKADEWEQTAARFVSLKPQLMPLQGLIARWRRLELQSWPLLLNGREEKIAFGARRWWLWLFKLLCASPETAIAMTQTNDPAEEMKRRMERLERNKGGKLQGLAAARAEREAGPVKAEADLEGSAESLIAGDAKALCARMRGLGWLRLQRGSTWAFGIDQEDVVARVAYAIMVTDEDAERAVAAAERKASADNVLGELFASLEVFCRSCQVGQYESRLQLLRSFGIQLLVELSVEQAATAARWAKAAAGGSSREEAVVEIATEAETEAEAWAQAEAEADAEIDLGSTASVKAERMEGYRYRQQLACLVYHVQRFYRQWLPSVCGHGVFVCVFVCVGASAP